MSLINLLHTNFLSEDFTRFYSSPFPFPMSLDSPSACEFTVNVIQNTNHSNEEMEKRTEGGICTVCGEYVRFPGLYFCNDCGMIACHVCDLEVHTSCQHERILVTCEWMEKKNTTMTVSIEPCSSNEGGSEYALVHQSSTSMDSYNTGLAIAENSCDVCANQRAAFLCSKCQQKLCHACDIKKHLQFDHKRVAIPNVSDLPLMTPITEVEATSQLATVLAHPSKVGSYILNGQHITYVVPDKQENNETPKSELTLDYIFTYGSFLFSSSFGANCLVYAVAEIAIRLDPITKSQDFFIRHTSPIQSMTMHPNKHIVASAQNYTSKDVGFICVWDVSALSCIVELHFHMIVRALAFAADGGHLFSLGDNTNVLKQNDCNSCVAVWNWTDKQIVKLIPVSDSATGLITQPSLPNSFAIFGVGLLQIYFLEKEMRIVDLLPPDFHSQVFTCCIFLADAVILSESDAAPTQVFVGTEQGDIQIFDMHLQLIRQKPKSHIGCVTCISVFKQFYISAGNDACVKIWISDSNLILLQPVFCFDLFQSYPAIMNSMTEICAMDTLMHAQMLLIGTSNHQLLQIDLSSIPKVTPNAGTLFLKASFLMQNPTDEVCSIACHPNGTILLSASCDRTVNAWDLSSHNCLTSGVRYEAIISSIALSDSGLAAVGLENGMAYIVALADLLKGRRGHLARGLLFSRMNARHLNCLSCVEDESISVISKMAEGENAAVSLMVFSPQMYLAVACNDLIIYLIETNKKTSGSLLRTFVGHTSPITSMDFSDDGLILMSVGRDLDVCYWDVETGVRLKANTVAVATANWLSWNSLVGFPVRGLATIVNNRDEMMMTCCTRSNFGDLIASADELSHLYLHQFPTYVSRNRMYHVPGNAKSLLFSKNDENLFAIISSNLSECNKFVFQYKCRHPSNRSKQHVPSEKETSKSDTKLVPMTLSEAECVLEIDLLAEARAEVDEIKNLAQSSSQLGKNEDSARRSQHSSLQSSRNEITSLQKDACQIQNNNSVVHSQENTSQNNSLRLQRINAKLPAQRSARLNPSYNDLVSIAKIKQNTKKSTSAVLPAMSPDEMNAEISSLRFQIADIIKEKSIWKTKLLKSQQDLKNSLKDELLISKAKSAIRPLSEFDDGVKTPRTSFSITNPYLDETFLTKISQETDQVDFVKQYLILREENAKVSAKLITAKRRFEKFSIVFILLSFHEGITGSLGLTSEEISAYREQKIELGKQFMAEKTKIELLLYQQTKVEEDLMRTHEVFLFLQFHET